MGDVIDVRQMAPPLGSTRVADLPELVSRVEIAEMLGVTRQRVHQLVGQSDFPEPVSVLGVGMIWRREDVEDWMRRTGRLPAEGETSD